MKVCKHCQEVKEDSDFYSGDSSCKACRIKCVSEYRKSNLEKVQEYDRQRRAKKNCAEDVWEKFLAKSRDFAKNNPNLRKSYVKKYLEANPKKRKCHILVGNAIKSGKLLPQACEVCGNIEVHGHHTDYDKPLEVLWLCAEHHSAWHKEHGEGLNAQ